MKRHRILVVEDQPSQASAIERTLRANGYEVRIAHDGKKGVETAVDWVPDAILMDVRLPVMNGLVAAAEIRKNRRTRHVPVAAITARSRPEDFLQGLLAGFNKYLTKPYSNQELLDNIAELLRHADHRAKLAVLAPARRELDQLLRVRGDREQIFTGLLAAVRAVVDCDWLAIQWQRGGRDVALVVTRTAAIAPALLDRVRDTLAQASSARRADEVLTICGTDRDELGAVDIRAGFDVPLCYGDECLGALYVGSARRDQFAPEDQQLLVALSDSLARVCASGLDIAPLPDPGACELVREIDVLIALDDPDDERRWACRVEECIPGLRVYTGTTILEAGDAEPGFHLVLVSPSLREAVDRIMFARARAGLPAFPVLELDPASIGDADAAVSAFVFMGLLISFMDASRSGCLHVGAQGGGAGSGLIVFHEGRIAWASSPDRQASLLAFLARRTQGNHGALRTAVAASARERVSLAEMLARDGVLTRDEFRAALKDYLVAVLSELMRVDRPRLLFSRQVVAMPHNESFAVDDITIEVLSP